MGNVNPKIDGRAGRVASSSFVDIRDRMRGNGKTLGAKESAPESATNTREGLATRTPDKEVDEMVEPHLTNRQRIALDYLAIAKRELEDAARNRIRYALLGREYGLTNRAIGDALGIGEASVRELVKRHSKPSCNRCGDEVSPGSICPECGLYDGGDA